MTHLYRKYINSTAKKLIFWLAAPLVSLVFLPFILGSLLVYFSWIKIQKSSIKIAAAAVLALLTLFVGSIWVYGIFSPTPSDRENEKHPLPTASVTDSRQTFRVVKVVDGDTLAVDINGTTESVRLIGINTPETVDPREPVQCFGVESSNKAKSILSGKTVILEADSSQGERDKYDRLLRYVFLADGTSFNKLMIAEGYAFEYTYNTPYKYQAEFQQAEKEARENKRGLWADDTCAGNLVLPTQTPAPAPTTVPSIPTAITTTPPTPTPVQSIPTTEPQPASCMYDCVSPDRDCSDFKTHQEALNFWNCCGFTATYDPMKLDGLGNKVDDGIPCESLP